MVGSAVMTQIGLGFEFHGDIGKVLKLFILIPRLGWGWETDHSDAQAVAQGATLRRASAASQGLADYSAEHLPRLGFVGTVGVAALQVVNWHWTPLRV